MQADAIVNRILADGRIKAEEVIDQAKQKASEKNKEAEDYANSKLEETKIAIAERSKQIEDRYVVLSHIEGNKVILGKKQEILETLKQKALEELLKMDKKKMLSFIEKLLKKNASKGETLLVNVPNLTAKDVETLKVVKDKALKIKVSKTSSQIGLTLTSPIVDKNLSFIELINSAFETSQEEINNILFS